METSGSKLPAFPYFGQRTIASRQLIRTDSFHGAQLIAGVALDAWPAANNSESFKSRHSMFRLRNKDGNQRDAFNHVRSTAPDLRWELNNSPQSGRTAPTDEPM